MPSSQPSNDQPYQSPYPELRLPEGGFASTIPPHLIEGADEQSKWLLNQISKNTQISEWSCHALLDTNAQVRKTNGRLLRAESQIAESQAKVELLEAQAKAISPFIKPLSQFSALWEYRAFRWVFYAAAFFFFTYLLPYYLKNPFDLNQFFKLFFPSS